MGAVLDPDPTRVGDPRREGGPLPVPDPDATRVGDPRTDGGPLPVPDPDPTRVGDRHRAVGPLPAPDPTQVEDPLSRSFALGFDQTPWPRLLTVLTILTT